jgi:hypothetical protein
MLVRQMIVDASVVLCVPGIVAFTNIAGRTQMCAGKCMPGLQALTFCELEWFIKSPLALKREKISGMTSLFIGATVPGTVCFTDLY